MSFKSKAKELFLESYLLTEGRTQPISKTEAREIFKSKIQPEFSSGTVPEIYRGVDKDIDYGWIEPSNYTRQSAHTKNYYTLILDNSERWSKYPDRSKSIVCTGSRKKAKDHGDVFRVFPLPGSKIGVCPTRDIWGSFWKVQENLNFYNLSDFNEVLLLVFTLFGASSASDHLSETWPDFKRDVNKISQSEAFLSGKISSDLFEDWKKVYFPIDSWKRKQMKYFMDYYSEGNFNTFFQMLEDLFDPEDNKFELRRFEPNTSFGGEVWTDGDSLMVRESEQDFVKQNRYID